MNKYNQIISLRKKYSRQTLEKASWHIYETSLNHLKPYQIKVLTEYLKRHPDLYPQL